MNPLAAFAAWSLAFSGLLVLISVSLLRRRTARRCDAQLEYALRRSVRLEIKRRLRGLGERACYVLDNTLCGDLNDVHGAEAELRSLLSWMNGERACGPRPPSEVADA